MLPGFPTTIVSGTRHRIPSKLVGNTVGASESGCTRFPNGNTSRDSNSSSPILASSYTITTINNISTLHSFESVHPLAPNKPWESLDLSEMTRRLHTRAEEIFGEEDAHERTRVDDKDPSISFAPDPSPYSKFPSSWLALNTTFAYQGTAVMTTKQNARLSMSFPGDSLSVALLYKADGVNAKVTIEDGTTFPLRVSQAEATSTAPMTDRQALQRKIFHLNGLSCANHTATLALNENPNPTVQAQELYFDWFSFTTPDSPSDCLVKAALNASTTTIPPLPTSRFTSTPRADPTAPDHTSMWAGISVGAAIAGFLLALFAVIIYRNTRRSRRQSISSVKIPSGPFRPRRAQYSSETLSMPLTMSQRTTNSFIRPEVGYLPSRVVPLAHDNSFGSSNHRLEHVESIVDSPSATAVFPLKPRTPERCPYNVEDSSASFNLGQTLMQLEHENRQQEPARVVPSTPPLRIFPSHDSPSLAGSHTLQRLPRESPPTKPIRVIKKPAPAKDARRPTTASAVDRLRAEARQLDVHRPLSPFAQARPMTSAGHPSNSYTTSLLHPPRAKRNSNKSNETQWSKASAESSAAGVSELGNPQWSKSMLDIPSVSIAVESELGEEGKKGGEGEKEKGEVLKTTDSEAEMWVSKRDTRRRAHSSGGLMPPRRPPKSPHRPSTGQEVQRGMRFQPFTAS